MKKTVAVLITAMVFMSGFAFCVSAASAEYNYKGFQLYIPSEFVRDLEWAKKYDYVDYWHTEDYMIEMVLIDNDFPQGDFIYEHSGEPYYDCHIINDSIYGYSSEFVSSEEVEFNGNTGEKRTYKKEYRISENDEWKKVNCVRYIFEKGDKYYEVCFYIHHETLYNFYPDMIMRSFDISPFTFFLRNRTWIILTVIPPIINGFVLTGKYKRKK